MADEKKWVVPVNEDGSLRFLTVGEFAMMMDAMKKELAMADETRSDDIYERVNAHQVANDPPTEPEVDLTAIKNLVSNWWKWNILDFAEAIGKPIPRGEMADEWLIGKFHAFTVSASMLRQFDNDILRVICTKKEE